jgi:hypothetical protein
MIKSYTDISAKETLFLTLKVGQFFLWSSVSPWESSSRQQRQIIFPPFTDLKHGWVFFLGCLLGFNFGPFFDPLFFRDNSFPPFAKLLG